MARISCNVISYTLKRTVNIEVVLPTVTIPEAMMNEGKVHHTYPAPFPVLYLLHGYGNNEKQWTGYTNVELYAEERQIAVVMIAGENRFYLDGETDSFAQFIDNELREFVTNTFPISSKREDAYIAGLSMGGFGALYHGLTHPEHYAAIGAFSPAVRMQGMNVDLTKMIVEMDSIPDLYIACGEDDFVYGDASAFAGVAGKKFHNVTWKSVPHFAHEWRFWDMQVEQFMDWIARNDYYKDKKRSV